MAGARPFVDFKLKQRKVVLFSKTYSPECNLIKEILGKYNLSDREYEVVEIEKRQDCSQIENYFQILCLTDSREVPQLFVEERYIGGEKELNLLEKSGELKKILENAKKGRYILLNYHDKVVRFDPPENIIQAFLRRKVALERNKYKPYD